MTIGEILEIENTNCGQIHLYRSGLFFRAYERSALAFLDIENYHVIKKHSSKLNVDYIYLGFPATIVKRVLEGRSYTQISDDYIVVQARKILIEELSSKKLSYPLAQSKPTPPPPPPRPQSLALQMKMFEEKQENITQKQEIIAQNDHKPHFEIAALIDAFDIDKSTPLMCQNFLSMIKQKLQLSSLN